MYGARSLSKHVWALCIAALGFTDARAATLDLVETVRYNFEFQVQSGGISIQELYWDEELWGPTVTHVDLTGGQYHSFYEFSFWLYGNMIRDFAGQTLDMSMLFQAPPAPIAEASWDTADPLLQNPRGYITFGSGNIISEWNISTHDIFRWGEADYHWSEPILVDGTWGAFSRIEDPSPYFGLSIYGDMFWAGDDHYYLTNPGRWLTSIEKRCFIGMDGSPVPCPDPVPPLNGCGPSGGIPPKCDVLALVPLPPSLLLLLTALGGVGVLGRTRKQAIRPAASVQW